MRLGYFLLARFPLFPGLQVLEMSQWQGSTLGIAMWTLVAASLVLFVATVWRGGKAFRDRRAAVQRG